MTTITASAVVVFDSATEGDDHISAQIDDRETGNNAGKTSFRPGDAPAFLVWCSLPGSLSVTAVGGTESPLGPTTTAHDQDVIEYLHATDSEIEISLTPPARGLPTMEWESESAGLALSTGKLLSDGSIASVIIRRIASTPFAGGLWIVGVLKWSASATAYKIQTSATTTAKRAILLAKA